MVAGVRWFMTIRRALLMLKHSWQEQIQQELEDEGGGGGGGGGGGEDGEVLRA